MTQCGVFSAAPLVGEKLAAIIYMGLCPRYFRPIPQCQHLKGLWCLIRRK